jgi:hypothetical protein
MEIQEIEVTIDENGEVKIQVHGTHGTTCLDLTADLEAALGGEVISREMTPEADAAVQEQIKERQKLKNG